MVQLHKKIENIINLFVICKEPPVRWPEKKVSQLGRELKLKINKSLSLIINSLNFQIKKVNFKGGLKRFFFLNFLCNLSFFQEKESGNKLNSKLL
jgi:hypothetical protein